MASSISAIMCSLKMDFFIKGCLFVSLLWSYADTAPRQKRLSLAAQSPSYYYTNVDGQPGTYSFGYDVFDPETGNTQFRSEERYPNGTVAGSYGYIDPRGRSRRYDYIADLYGYRIMNDASLKQIYEVPMKNENPSTESVITWSRPRKSNKKKQQIRNERPSNFLPTNFMYNYI